MARELTELGRIGAELSQNLFLLKNRNIEKFLSESTSLVWDSKKEIEEQKNELTTYIDDLIITCK